MIDDVPTAKSLYREELELAKAFVETLPDGEYNITSGKHSTGYCREKESGNWYYAVGGYSSWGKGKAKVCNGAYVLEFQYKFQDRYNWDGKKAVKILGVTVTDKFMGQFHRQGLAREFMMYGSVSETVSWGSPVVAPAPPAAPVPPPRPTGGRS